MADKNVRYLTPVAVDTKKDKYCRFKKHKIKYVDYKDAHFLRQFLNEQGKILPRRLTGTSLPTKSFKSRKTSKTSCYFTLCN